MHKSDPMVLIDGVPFFNMNKVFAVDPLRLHRLDAVPYGYAFGPSFEDGVFSFNSYKNDYGGAEPDASAVILDYEGLQKQRKFYEPAYDTEQQEAGRIPDYRNVLYWSPSITTNASGKGNVSFYTSDRPGKYIGVIQGITQNRNTGSQTFTFEVKQVTSAEVK